MHRLLLNSADGNPKVSVASTYRQMKEQIRKLELDAERVRRNELRRVLMEIRAQVKEYGITAEQLFGSDLSDLVRFRDPESGRTWNGQGRPPNWIRGKDRKRYAVG